MIAPHALQLLKRYEQAIADQHGVTLDDCMTVNWQDQIAAGARDDYARAGVDLDDPIQATAAFIGALDVFDTVMTAGMQAQNAVLYELRVLHFLADCAQGGREVFRAIEPPAPRASFWRRVLRGRAGK